MFRPELLLDIDGIFADFLTPCLKVLEELMGQSYEVHHTTTWDVMEALNIPKPVQAEAYKRMKVEGFCYALPQYPGAVEAMKQLHEVADVYVVTSPLGGPFWAHEREKWLYDHYGIPGKKVISTNAKYKIDGDVFVDDKTSHLVAWRERHNGCPVRWDQPYNVNDEWNGVHTNKWDVLYGIVLGVGSR